MNRKFGAGAALLLRMKIWEILLNLINAVLANIWGSIQKPYATYRRLEKEDPYQLLVLFGIIGSYFFLVSPLKYGLHPFILTLNTARLFTATIASYLGIVLLLMVLGKILKGAPNLRAVLLNWGYSLVPTLIWFLSTSIFYVLLPPPRHETWLGRLFSLLFVTFSLSLLFWKGILYYLTLRFGLKFNLQQIIAATVIFIPLLIAYSLLMYNWNIFRIPFI